MQPRDFEWKSTYLDHLYQEDESHTDELNAKKTKRKTAESNTRQGFIAQEVKTAVFEETGSNNSFSGVMFGDYSDYDSTISSNADDIGRIDAEKFVPVLVKAVQQLSAKIDVLEARIDELENP